MWTIDGSTYDFSTLATTHPGGSYIIDAAKHTDCTSLYFSSHPCVECDGLRRRIKRYRVRDGAPTREWQDTVLYDELKRTMRSYRSSHGDLAAPFTAWVWYGLLTYWFVPLAWCWFCCTATFFQHVALGGVGWLLLADLTHSGSHGAIIRAPGGCETVLATLRWLTAPFCIHAAWVRQHILGHHSHTNSEQDPDLYHHPRHAVGWRLAPWTAWSPAYRHWLTSFSLGLWATQLQPSLANAAAMVAAGRYPGTEEPVTWVGRERLSCALQTALMSGLLLRGTYEGGPIILVPFGVCGCLFYVFSQVSHINELAFATPAKDGWAEKQIQAARGDYLTTSAVATLLSIGLNHQAIHHLFPTVHPFHYPALAERFSAVLARRGVAYDGPRRSYADAFRDHVAWLAKLNAQEKVW